jgi:hypothetical protein
MAKSKIEVELDTKLLDRLIRDFEELDGTEVSAGYYNSKPHPIHLGSTFPDIAYVNNYGANGLARRPFMSDAGQDNINKITGMVADAIDDLLRFKPYKDNLEAIGLVMANNIKARITTNSYTPNAEAYLQYKQARWGSSDPLIASGQLRDNVEHKVTGDS